MLVLTRKKEEKLQIGNEITITVLRIKGRSVQLGIEAPKAVRVARQELLAPRGENQAAPCQQVELTLDAAEEHADDRPQQPAPSASRTKGGASLHALVAQVFRPARVERLITA